MGNGQKAQMRRDRNAKNASKEPNSQLKVNEKAKNIMCTVCRQTFLCTSRPPALTAHAENKHNKTMQECFPNWSMDTGK